MKKKKLNEYLNLLVKLAMSMVTSIFVCFGTGIMLEKMFPFHGVFIIVATFIGVMLGFYFIYLQLRTFF